MSDSNAIAAVTSTLQHLLLQGVRRTGGLDDTRVTLLPLDQARDAEKDNQLNLFLYQAVPSAAWRNRDASVQSKPGETAFPALGLNLYYLVTAFGKDNDTGPPFSHELLGRAMGTLNDHPLLSAAEIRAAFPDSNLWMQTERVRITLQPLPVEDIFKLWSGFQTHYRLSVSYEVAVVLIDSQRAATAPLPVTRRGPQDSGAVAQASAVSPLPTLTGVALPGGPALELGTTLVFSGLGLDGDTVSAVFEHQRTRQRIVLQADAGASATEVRATPSDAGSPDWLPGVYLVFLNIVRAGVAHPTNTVSVPLALTVIGAPPAAVRVAGGVTVTVAQVSPKVAPEQPVSLLLGDTPFPARTRTDLASSLVFDVGDLPPGPLRYRIRADGVDTLFIDRSVKPPTYRDLSIEMPPRPGAPA